MIRFENISKGFMIDGAYRLVIDRLSLTLPGGRSLALLGRNGAGKSTLLQMVAGTMRPDTGMVVRDGTVSFTVGYAGSFHGDMTGAQNTRFVARVYGVDSDDLCAFVEEFAELGPHFNAPVRTYSSGMKSRLAFGISMGIRFDTYLIDEVTASGDARFRRKSKALFRARMAGASAIMVSHRMSELRDFCDAGLVLHDGALRYFDDVDEAIALHEALMA